MDNKNELPSFYNEIESTGKLKKLKNAYKRLTRKKILWMLEPYENQQNQYLKGQAEHNIQADLKIKDLSQELDFEKEKNAQLKDELEFRTGALARQLMLVKWKQIDKDAELNEKATDIIQCRICGHEAQRGTYDTKISKCQFNGGKLVRYICPQCGVIFGPTKFSSLPQEELDEDYTVHYFGFNESVLTYKEVEAFYMLKPDKSGVYLNYGCGCWSKSIQQLRDDGYNVYGYEPYAPETENPYMITNKDDLMKMKFDGIFSNDLLEHLINPIEDLKFMKSLLKDPRSKMSHSTACYIYKYEVTRFHTHFFTGDSVKVMCEKVGMNVLDFRDAMENRDFMCYVYGVSESDIDYKPSMYVSENGIRKENTIILHKDGLICGPYTVFGPMHYEMTVGMKNINENQTVMMEVTANKGQKVIQSYALTNGNNEIAFELDQFENDCEFKIINSFDQDIIIDKLAMR